MSQRAAGGRRRTWVGRQLAIFYTVAATTLLVVGAGAFFASRTVAQNQALEDAERMTIRLGALVVGPLLGPALAGDAARREELERTIATRLDDGYLTEVTVWGSNGRVVFSDDADAIGTYEALPEEAADAIRSGATHSAFEEKPEVLTDGTRGKDEGFVEVYVPLTIPGDQVYAFEVYYDYGRVNQTADSLLWHIAPLVFVPLVLLQVVQVPIAASLARRVRRQEADRARLLEQALTLSEKERVRIAADLHDGPIQDLAGVGYALGTFVPALPDQHRVLAGKVNETVHHAVDSLRRMMVDIYPPDLATGELAEALDGLATPLREQGIDVSVSDDGLPDLDADTITALYRVTREALFNVASHARATAVDITLAAVTPAVSAPGRRHHGGAGSDGLQARLVVADNGVGFAEGDLDRRSEGHLGLRLLRDRVQSMGGDLSVTAPAGGGTTVTAVLPVLPVGSASGGEPLSGARVPSG